VANRPGSWFQPKTQGGIIGISSDAPKQKENHRWTVKRFTRLAELTVLPEFLDDVKGALKQALIPTLQEAGCEGMFETSREGVALRLNHRFTPALAPTTLHPSRRVPAARPEQTYGLSATVDGALTVINL
jgi:hypothetical protein